MGLYTELLWPFMGWMLVIGIGMSVVCVIINKLMMYHGPEDEEIWTPGKEHFNMLNADERIRKLKEAKNG